MLRAVYLLEDAVEVCRSDVLTLGEAQIERRKKLCKRDELLPRRGIMDTVDELAVKLLCRFRGADIRLDHEFFDELHRLELVADAHTRNAAILADVDLVFGQIEI